MTPLQWRFYAEAWGAIAPPLFGFAYTVWGDATKIVTMNYISLLCRSKRLTIRDLLALYWKFCKLMGTPNRDGQPRRRRSQALWSIAPPFLGLEPPLPLPHFHNKAPSMVLGYYWANIYTGSNDVTGHQSPVGGAYPTPSQWEKSPLG